jgi:polyribonucleotide 5'-hydroxyl-kinase
MKAEDNQTKIVEVGLTPKELLNHVLAISFATTTEELIMSNVAGFIVVTNVNVKDQKISVLSPQPKPLPPTLLIMSDVQYIDSS